MSGANKYQNKKPCPRAPTRRTRRDKQGRLFVLNQDEIDIYRVELRAYHQEAERMRNLFVEDGKRKSSPGA